MKKKGVFSKIYIGLMMLFLFAPILVLIVFSFNESKSRALFTGFTFKWYIELFQNETIISALWGSLSMAFCAATIAAIVGTAAAVGIHRIRRKSVRSLIMNVTYLPVLNPEIVTGISMMLLFVYFKNLFGMKLGFGTVLIAHVTFCLPYAILNVLPKLRQMDPSLYEAAQDLGCTPVRAFIKVVVPEIMPGIISGYLMSFTFSLDDFIITYFTSGSGFTSLPLVIYSMVRKKVNPQINALSAIIFVVVLLMLLISNIVQSRKEKRD
jgi:spermidine/putrescine transport system permease protein